MTATCPRCGNTSSNAPRGSSSRPGRFQCGRCHKYFTDQKYKFTDGGPRVLLFDIETLPIIGNFWDTGKQYIGADNILEDWVVLSWSAKALFSSDVRGDILTPEEIHRRNEQILYPLDAKDHYADERIVQRIWKYLDEADVVITQNGIKFDERKLNARFLYYNLPPPRPFHHIDTLRAAQSAFATSSHRLGYMTKWLGLTRKLDTNFSLWQACQLGDPTALAEMYTYGINDTNILEEYYMEIRAWIPKHPNFSVYTNQYKDLKADHHICPVCTSKIDPASLKDTYRTPIGNEYLSGRCGNCGTYIRKQKKKPGTPPLRVTR